MKAHLKLINSFVNSDLFLLKNTQSMCKCNNISRSFKITITEIYFLVRVQNDANTLENRLAVFIKLSEHLPSNSSTQDN